MCGRGRPISQRSRGKEIKFRTFKFLQFLFLHTGWSIQNIRKLAPYENFPLYGIYIIARANYDYASKKFDQPYLSEEVACSYIMYSLDTCVRCSICMHVHVLTDLSLSKAP